jgi:hypothetical protein
MVIPVEQSIVNFLLLGGLVAILYSLRYLVVLERRLITLEQAMQKLLAKVEQEEQEILQKEELLAKKLVKKPRMRK